MTETLMSITLEYEKNRMAVQKSFANPPTFFRSDTIDILGQVYGQDLTGLSAKLTGKIILPDGTPGPNVITKTSAASGGITLTSVNAAVSRVRISIGTDDTKGFQPGDKIIFDVEFITTTTPPIVRTIVGAFILAEDYTLNA